jgi:hypothetical protein
VKDLGPMGSRSVKLRYQAGVLGLVRLSWAITPESV